MTDLEDHPLVEWYIPGPIDVNEEVLSRMSTRPYGHRTSLMSDKIKSINKNMLALLDADPEGYTVLLFGGSGTNVLEAGARSFSYRYNDDTVLSVSSGYFGDLWADIFESNEVPVKRWRIEDRKVIEPQKLGRRLREGYRLVAITHNETSTGATNNLAAIAEVVKKYNALFLVDAVSSLGGVPIYPQALGIDYLVTSTQKCLGVPPGLGIAIVSERALSYAENIGPRGYTTDVLRYAKEARNGNTVTTPPQAQIEALEFELDYIINEEGPEERFARHHRLAEMTRDWASSEGFELFPDSIYASDTVSCFQNTRDVDLKAVQKKLYEGVDGRRYGFDPGYRKVNDNQKQKGQPPTFRIAHMGDRTEEQLGRYLDALSTALREYR